MDSSQVLKGLLDSVILGALTRGPAHGYALVQRIHGLGLTSVAEPSVYGTLRRLFRSGLLSAEVRESTTGPPRKVYALNEEGREQLRRDRSTWGELKSSLGALIEMEEESA